MQRERLGSRLGFILLSAGCAIGVGNVWKFPYMVGQYGGGAFVLLYLFFLLVMGVPVLTMEFAVGRAAQKSPVLMHAQLVPEKKVWHLHGYIAFIGNWLLMMFYTTVSGWMLRYFVATASGELSGMDTAQVNDFFGTVQSNPVGMVVYMTIVVLLGFGISSVGLQSGVERVTKFMMIALIVIMMILAVNSIFMDGGKEGLAFYLIPDLDRMMSVGFREVVVGAMTQSFFTLSLGMGGMAIFGSYINKDRALMGEAVNVCALDTFVALCSGLIIFPACFAYGVEANAGPPLIFMTLPNIFNNIPMGRLWGSLFFVFMSFAALTTVLGVFELIISCTTDLFGWSRKNACLIDGILMFFLALPCALGFNVLSFIQPLGAGSVIMDLEDFIVSNLILPGGSLVFILFCTLRYGWGWDKFTAEANEGKGLKVAQWMRPYCTFILPVIVGIILVLGLI